MLRAARRLRRILNELASGATPRKFEMRQPARPAGLLRRLASFYAELARDLRICRFWHMFPLDDGRKTSGVAAWRGEDASVFSRSQSGDRLFTPATSERRLDRDADLKTNARHWCKLSRVARAGW